MYIYGENANDYIFALNRLPNGFQRATAKATKANETQDLKSIENLSLSRAIATTITEILSEMERRKEEFPKGGSQKKARKGEDGVQTPSAGKQELCPRRDISIGRGALWIGMKMWRFSSRLVRVRRRQRLWGLRPSSSHRSRSSTWPRAIRCGCWR